jgi:hypothetical protein
MNLIAARMPARAAGLFIVVSLVAYGAAGCGGGEESRVSNHPPITGAHANAVAVAINLQRSDFAAGTKAVPQPFTGKERREERAEERRCYGKITPSLADRKSDAFLEQTGHGTRGTTSQVIIRPSTTDAQTVLAKSRKGQTQSCLARELRRALAHTGFRDLGGAYPRIGHTAVSTLPVSASGSDGSVAWRYTTSLAVARHTFPEYQDAVVFAYGQAEVYLVSFGIGHPFPVDKERSLVTFLLERARLHAR